MAHCLVELAAALNVPTEKILPQVTAEESSRVKSAIDEIADSHAADFVTAGLQKAKVLKK